MASTKLNDQQVRRFKTLPSDHSLGYTETLVSTRLCQCAISSLSVALCVQLNITLVLLQTVHSICSCRLRTTRECVLFVCHGVVGYTTIQCVIGIRLMLCRSTIVCLLDVWSLFESQKRRTLRSHQSEDVSSAAANCTHNTLAE